MSTMFDKTITIQAPLHLVWLEVHKFARRGKIVTERMDQLLFATQLSLGYVYWLEENVDGSTRLRHVIDKAATIEERIGIAPNIPAALAEMSAQPETSGGELLHTALNIFEVSSPEETGETTLNEIKKKSESEAQKSHWTPRPVSYTTPSETLPLVQEAAIGSPESVPGKPPFSPWSLIGLSILFSFGAAGILAGLNWKRLGKPERMWPTILISILGLLGFLAALMILPLGDAGKELGYLVNIGIGALLQYWQKPYYKQWETAHGKAKTGASGCLIQAGIALGTLVVVVLAIFGFTVVNELNASATPQTFTGGGLQITYPGTWQTIDLSQQDWCKQPNIECLLGIIHSKNDGTNLIVAKVPLGQTVALEELDQALWTEFSSSLPGVNLTSREQTKVAGLAAIQRIFTFSSEKTPAGKMNMMQIYLPKDTDLYLVNFTAPNSELFTQHKEEVDAMITSIAFTP